MSVVWRDYASEKNFVAVTRGTWAYSFSYLGARYRKVGFSSKAAALQAEKAAKTAAIKAGGCRHSHSKMGFSELIDRFLEERKLLRAPNTVKCEISKARILKKAFKNQPVQNISVADVEAYRHQRLSRGKAANTINLELILLRCCLNYAVTHGHIFSNPAKSVKNVKVLLREKTIPTDAELATLLDESAKKPWCRQLVVWIWLSAYSGMRPSESHFLRWSDVNFERQTIKVEPQDGNPVKSGRHRAVPIHPSLLPVLQGWREEWIQTFRDLKKKPPHDWVFFGPREPHTRCESFRKSFMEAVHAAGLSNITRYSLRHLFISKCIMSGVGTFTVAKWVGHGSTLMIERVYGHLTPEYMSGEMQKVKMGMPDSCAVFGSTLNVVTPADSLPIQPTP